MTCRFQSRPGRLALCAIASLALFPDQATARPESHQGVAEQQNLFLSDYGTHVVSFSSEFGSGWEAANLTPSRADLDPQGSVIRPMIWSSASMAPFPHWIVFAFDRPRWITTLVLDNYLEEEADHPGISAKDIEVWAGNETDTLAKVGAIRLEKNRPGQRLIIAPTQTRFVKLVIKSNFGHPWYTEMGAPAAFDDGTRPLAER